MSKAERKRLAKTGTSTSVDTFSGLNVNEGKKKTATFKDNDNFIGMVPSDKATEDGYAVTQGKYGNLEDAVLDLNPDSTEDLYKTQRRTMKHWDRKKKKYITIQMNEIDRITGKRKKPPPTGGSKKKSKTLQSQYDKWADKTKRSIGRAGAPEQGNSAEMEVAADWRNGYRSAHKKTSDGIVRTHIVKAIKQVGKNGRPIKDELRSERDIRKFKKMKERKAMQLRGIRPHKKLAPNVSRPSKQKQQFKRIR